MSELIPLTIIGGYLGAGKTTLLNHILRHNDGFRLTVLVNDFGDINIDAELVENQDGDTINLANGCICCTLADGFVGAINTILEQNPHPDRIIVEASGVSDPIKIAQYAQMRGVSLDGVIVVADAEKVQAKVDDKYVGYMVSQQLNGADILILNKVDLVDQDQRPAVRGWLAEAAPHSRIYETQYGNIPLELLLGIDTKRKSSTAGSGSDILPFVTWSYVEDAPLQRRLLARLLDDLPKSIFRAKGFLNLQNVPQHRTILQLVGRRWVLSPGRAWDGEKPQTRIVWIGENGQFEQEGLAAALDACTHPS